MMQIQNWSVSYPDGTRAVDGFDLSLNEGEHVALIGANGAGKSTLLLSLVGVLKGQGRVQVGETVLKQDTLQKIRSQVGVVFQNPDDQLFLPTVYENVAFGPRNQGLSEEQVRYRVEDRLKLLQIEKLRDKSAMKLSGGEKRLVAMATVLAMKPKIMLFDEPTAFLDPKARRNLIGILNQLPHTMLIATHDLTFAAQICDRCVVIRQGKVFADGKTNELLYDEALMEQADVEAITRF